MAKKAQKGKPAKKVAKPVKKAAAKKPAKKAAPKKAAKPVKKVAPKKAVKKPAPKKAAKSAKKVIAKKPIKKVTVKKVVPKKVAKPVKKIAAQKIAIKKVAAKKTAPKKAAVKKVVEKPIVKKLKKAEEKAIAKANAVVMQKLVPPPTKKEIAAIKKKNEATIDMDDDSTESQMIVAVEYKAPAIRRPMGPAPTPHINKDKRTRYTDAELKEFKQLINKKLSEAQKDYELLKSTLSHRDDHGTDDTSPTFKLLEDGSDVLSKEETAHLAGRQEKFIQNLQNALIRIENKTYGICRATGKLISKERLRSVPHATLAIEAKLVQKV